MEFLSRWLIAVLVALLGPSAGTCYSQTNFDESMRQMEAQRRDADLEMQRSRIQQLQFDADMARLRAETNRMQVDTERIRADTERMSAEREAQETTARQEEIARTAAKKAEEEASELRDEIIRAGVKTRNSFYLVGLVAMLVGFGAFVVKLKRRGLPMQENEKFGLATVIVSFLLALLSLMMSANWAYNLDFLSNLMITLKIQLFSDEYISSNFLIDFPTKYFLLVCMSAAAYGVTTYLGITPSPWKKKIKEQQETAARPL
jgi:hypothetical protein